MLILNRDQLLIACQEARIDRCLAPFSVEGYHLLSNQLFLSVFGTHAVLTVSLTLTNGTITAKFLLYNTLISCQLANLQPNIFARPKTKTIRKSTESNIIYLNA